MSRSRKSGIQQPPPEPKRYEIVLTRAAERGLASLPKTELRRVDAKIQGLAEIPRPPGVKKRALETRLSFFVPCAVATRHHSGPPAKNWLVSGSFPFKRTILIC